MTSHALRYYSITNPVLCADNHGSTQCREFVTDFIAVVHKLLKI